QQVRGDGDPASVDQPVTMADDLWGCPDGACPAQLSDGAVAAMFQHSQQQLAGSALGASGYADVPAEPGLQGDVAVAHLLLFVQADAEVAQSPAAEAVHARRVELTLGRVLGAVGDGDADAAGELDLWAGVIGHVAVTPAFGAGPSWCSAEASASRFQEVQ